MNRHYTIPLALLAVAVFLLPQLSIAADDLGSASIANTPSVLGGFVDKIEKAFVDRGNVASAALVPFAMKLLGLGFVLQLAYLTLQWFFEAKQLASLFGTFLNTTLRFAIIAALLVPIAGTSGYSTATGIVSDASNTVAKAVSGGAYTSGSSIIVSGGGQLLKSGLAAYATLAQMLGEELMHVSAASAFTGSAFATIGIVIMAIIIGIALVVVMMYALFQIVRAIMYGIVMLAIGTAVGPFFIAMLFLPITANIGMHWFQFMLVASFVKVVVAFFIGVVGPLGSALVPTMTAGALGSAFAIMGSFAALLLIYVVIGWLLSTSIQIANALLPGSIGAPGGLGVVSAALGATAAALGAAAGAMTAATSSSAKVAAGGAGSSGGDGGGGSSGTPAIDAQIASNVPAAASSGGGSDPKPPLPDGPGGSPGPIAAVAGAGASTSSSPAGSGGSTKPDIKAAAENVRARASDLGPAAANVVKQAASTANKAAGGVASAAVGAGKAAIAIGGAMSGNQSMAKAYASGFNATAPKAANPTDTPHQDAGSDSGSSAATPSVSSPAITAADQSSSSASGSKAPQPSRQERVANARSAYQSNAVARASSSAASKGSPLTGPQAKKIAANAGEKFDKASPATQDRYASSSARVSVSASSSSSAESSTSGSLGSAQAGHPQTSVSRSNTAAGQSGVGNSEPQVRSVAAKAGQRFDSASPEVQERFARAVNAQPAQESSSENDENNERDNK